MSSMSTTTAENSYQPNPDATPLSLIDFATIFSGERPADAYARSVTLAQRAEELGYSRIWYAEHHNMSSIASAAPAVLISHVGAHTSRIRLGAGGVMLPNHSPLVVAEQFGTLAELYPNRIDLGLGRAPGTDQRTLLALRRDASAADHFPSDVAELAGYLSDESRIHGISAVPGQGTHVPLIILGSSLFGANLAAQMGLPYSFASHFAPQALEEAVAHYRGNYQPSERFPEPYVIAAVNVTAADTTEVADEHAEHVRRGRVKAFLGRQAGRRLSDEEIDMLVESPQGKQIIGMLKYWAIGTGDQVRSYLTDFTQTARADELMISLQSPDTDSTMRSLEILADVWGISG